MSNFEGLENKISYSKKNSKNKIFRFTGLDGENFSTTFTLFLHRIHPFLDHNHLFVFSSSEESEKAFAIIRQKLSSISSYEVILFPGHENTPYSGILSSEINLYKRFNALSKIVTARKNNRKVVVICDVESLSMYLPPQDFFSKKTFLLEQESIIDPFEIKSKLVSLGYQSSIIADDPGTFSLKGEILDIYPINSSPVRIIFFDEIIEHIFSIDTTTGRTNKNEESRFVEVGPTPQTLLGNEYIQQLRSNIPTPLANEKELFNYRQQLFQRLNDGYLFDNYPVYTPFFFDKKETIIDYLSETNTIITLIECEKIHQSLSYLKSSLENSYSTIFENNNENTTNNKNDKLKRFHTDVSERLLPAPERLYDFQILSHLNKFFVFETYCVQKNTLLNDLGESSHVDLLNMCDLQTIDTIDYLKKANTVFMAQNQADKIDQIKANIKFLKDTFLNFGQLYLCYQTETSKEELLFLFDYQNLSDGQKSKIHLLNLKIDKGLFLPSENILVVADSDLFATKKIKTEETRAKKNIDLFAEQLATLKIGDYVVHNTHGIGIYKGLEVLEIGNTKSDFIIIEYTDNDKVYLPIYKMNLVQKYADGNIDVSVQSIRSNKFNIAKENARKSAQKLAFDLLKLHAERESNPGFSFSAPDHTFREFELSFAFKETPDQLEAIIDVINDMQKRTPMDRLVCGDVGFGKTEVAMRAAFKAVIDNKQVAVLVPTTILALQHYHTFANRFKNFPVRIDFLSRFKKASEEKEIANKLEKGEIDIVIGTHKLFAEKIKYKDLGLVIVDEEHRFGVAHKEKLKLLKTSVDFLTLTATPIPRTLQLSFLGIRDLSLIQTAPPKRQSIKTFIVKEDDATIQNAIEKELSRGGQVFIVHNRVNDIEIYAQKIKELVPSAKIIIAHGQLSERELENRMESFYSGAYQILISTTIIESGIDIPSANTLIIDRADTFGLAQLHQLRGRIGRSDKLAYAYFVVPSNREISRTSEERLKALRTYAEKGSGFSLASCDLEIRGAGDILGAQQSGHIEAIGLELYTELLKESIAELKGEKRITNSNLEINTSLVALISTKYISDSSERLKQYKRLANCLDINVLKSIEEEFVDIWGPYPEEVSNLFTILKIKSYMKHLPLKSVTLLDSSIILQFEKSSLERCNQRDDIIKFFMQRPKVYQFTPDYKVIYTSKESISRESFLKFAKDIAEQLVLC